MQPGDQFAAIVDIVDADGVGVTGLTSGDITFPAYLDGAAQGALGIDTWTEIGAGRYAFEITLPGTGGYTQIFPTPDTATYESDPPVYEGPIESNDLDSLAALTVRQPVIALGTNSPPFRDFTIRCYQNDYREIIVPILDESGEALDVSAWNDARFGVKSADGTTTSYQQTTGITLANGTATIAIPEDASFYTALAAGVAQVELWWSLDADPDDDTQTQTLRAGKLVIQRQEN
jgi:hypothetical protein